MDLGIIPNFNVTKAQFQQKQSRPSFGMNYKIVNVYADSFRRIDDLGDEPRCFLADLRDAMPKFNMTLNRFAKDKTIEVVGAEYVPWNGCIPSKLKVKLADGTEYSIHRKLMGKEHLSPQDTILHQLNAIEGQKVENLSDEEFREALTEL